MQPFAKNKIKKIENMTFYRFITHHQAGHKVSPEKVGAIVKSTSEVYKYRYMKMLIWQFDRLYPGLMVAAAGLEPTTHSLGNCCSILMSYAANF